MSTPQRLSAGAARLFQAWSTNARLAAVLASHVARPEVTRLLWRDRRFNYDFWSRLVEYESGLRHTLAVPLLVEMVEEAIKNKAEALGRYADEKRGVTGSRLALALYRAWRGEMTPAQIIEIIDSVSVGNTKLTHKITHLDLDNVLREFEFLLAHPLVDAGSQALSVSRLQAQAEDTLFEFWDLICAGGLGPGWGQDFRRYLDERLKFEEASRKQARRRLKRTLRQRFKAVIGRRQAAATAQGQGRAPSGWTVPPVPAAPDGPADLSRVERAAPLPRVPGAELVPTRVPGAELVPTQPPPAAEPTQPLVKPGWRRGPFQRLFGGRGKRAASKNAADSQDARGAP